MAEAEVFETEEEGVVTLAEKHLPATEETYVRVLYTTKGAEKHDDVSDSVIQPLLHRKRQGSRDENTQTATDGADRKTSVPQQLELAGRDQPGCSGSVRSLCSDSSQHECPICSELFNSHGDHRITLLNCNHTLCHHCTAGIMRQAKDPSRLQCPFCRQTTPFPQWEIRRLQEESYSNSVYEPGPALVISPGPELQVPASPLCCFALLRQLEAHRHRNICGCCIHPSCLVRGLRLMRLHSLCFSITALLLLVLALLGCFLYIVVPVIMLSILFSTG
ncbi:E3 ubiquitin-protein ligase RNF186-like [Siniperca chuatsi]|uniref:E3 ubiquitin-protein ligase RNF186-like n=1 Tax=Siniperca chuatsi TaxID=119488 RepID=UPI001CE14D6A|nr:E3 ubiquitin-protein ligase RNF186-like [Siniperca chuatsi]